MTNRDATEACTNKELCSCCGVPMEIDTFDQRASLTKLMHKKQLCFTCAFWKDKIENPVPDREIINGSHYVIHEWQSERCHFQGFGGASMYILKNDGTVKRSNNVWFQGNIPDRFKSELSNTAKFITKTAYYKIKENVNFSCNKKGCWDRYNCFFYHPEEMEKQGAWNKVPDSHKPGNECCELFLNKDNVFSKDDNSTYCT